MAYSTNPVTVERMLPYLGPLMEGRETMWRTEPGRSRWLAYRIREALAVAAEYPERFPALAQARFKIEVVSSNEVRAVVRGFPQVEVDVEPSEPLAPARMETGEVSEAAQIIAHWESLAPGLRQKVYFPNADIGEQGLLSLYEWGQGAGVLFFENAGAITLLPREGNEDAEAYAWTPDDLDTEPSITWRE